MAVDALDRKILGALQEDATLALDEIAQKVGSSKTPVWNRIKKLRDSGVIKKTVAVLDGDKLGYDTVFFVLIRTSEHDATWMNKFLGAVRKRPEVMEAHRLAGEIDYILKVRVTDAKAYDAFYRDLISEVPIYNVTSTLSMEEIKATTAVPL